jgi:putative ABC transport system permease protein
MLILQHITKDYKLGDTVINALRGIDLSFRKNEFVAVLGPSGCGKTTLLNIIGGLDRYTSGDLSINGKSTKDFTDADWDSYRNRSVGFVFQSYNLISHQNVLSNVELALTLSGVGKAERRRRAREVLERVGLGDQLYKKPNQMSGGQMQRVAIARALINDPDILLADEPTGALDTETSVQIMDILKEISKDRLVIMVTHNPDLADAYATRIVRLLDGVIVGDSDPFNEHTIQPVTGGNAVKKKARTSKKTSMSFATALSLSLNNLMTKKTRTFLTAFAGSIGIIGIALILSLSNGVQSYIDRVQEDTLSTYPLTISTATGDMSGLLSSFREARVGKAEHGLDAVYSSPVMELLLNSMLNMDMRKNDLASFLSYLNSEESGASEHISGIKYNYDTSLNIFASDTADGVVKVNPSPVMEQLMGTFYNTDTLSGMSISPYSSIPEPWEELLDNEELMRTQYDVIAGGWPQKYDEVVLIVDKNNEISDLFLYSLGFKDRSELDAIMKASLEGEELKTAVQAWSYEELLGKTFKLVLPTDCYQYDKDTGLWKDMTGNESYMKYIVDNGMDIKIVGIIRPSKNAAASAMTGAIGYTSELSKYYLSAISDSQIVRQQLAEPDIDVFTGLPFEKAGEEPLRDGEKASAFIKYFSGLTEAEKASLYKKTASSAPEEELAAMAERQLSGMSRADIEAFLSAQAVEQMGMEEEKVAAYFKGMSDEELYSYMKKALIQSLSEKYAAEAARRLEGLSDEQAAAEFEAYIASLDEKALAALYDKYASGAVSSSTYDENLKKLGYNDMSLPSSIDIYAATFEDKDAIVDMIKNYNSRMEAEGREESVIHYTDYVGLLMSSITTIINAISYVLVAFVSISLVVSSTMIGIITYISVLERTKEIGILRSIGASKRDIARVFNAETLSIGFGSGIFGIALTLPLAVPINLIIRRLTGIPYLGASLPAAAGAILVLISMLLTFIAGLIPSRIAARRDPVVALRTE